MFWPAGREPPFSAHQNHQQASAADLRQADDLLPDPDAGRCGDPGHHVVTGGRNAGDFLRLLANGKEFGLKHLNYAYQEGEGGIADALALAEHFADGERICVILGDNIIEGSDRRCAVQGFESKASGARILLKEVPDAERFGVAEIAATGSSASKRSPKSPSPNSQ